MSVFMQPIAYQQVGATPVSSITFSNIPQGYQDLHIVMSMRSSNAAFDDGVNVRFNGDGGYNYNSQVTYGAPNGNTGAFRGINSYYTRIGYCDGNTATANTFGTAQATVSNYSGGAWKQVKSTGNDENSYAAGTYPLIQAGLWKSTAPITSLSFYTDSGATFLQYSSITIYGVSAQYSTSAPTAPTIGTPVDQSGFVSVNFTPAPNDQATVYAVTTNPVTSTTYGNQSPIVAPATLGTSTTYQISAINNNGTTLSGSSSAITTNNNYVAIATAVVGAGGLGTINFTNIPQNYTHLQIRATIRSSVTSSTDQSIMFNFNGDTSTSYNVHRIYGSGNASQSFIGLTGMFQVGVPTAIELANVYNYSITDIHDYTSGYKGKTITSLGGYSNNTGGEIMFSSGYWSGTSPVTSIGLGTANTFVQYSQVALYGIA